MAIDTYWTWVATGSTVTTSSGPNGLFGSYSGLSLLSTSEVIVVKIYSSGGDLRLSGNPAIGATDDIGLFIHSAASLVELFPMVRSEASQMTFTRTPASETGSNPVAQWTIWRRVP